MFLVSETQACFSHELLLVSETQAVIIWMDRYLEFRNASFY